jgi:hypothetical protein
MHHRYPRSFAPRVSIILPSELDDKVLLSNTLMSTTPSMFPSLTAIQARNEDGRGFICRPRLHFIIGALPLVAAITLIFVSRLALITL